MKIYKLLLPNLKLKLDSYTSLLISKKQLFSTFNYRLLSAMTEA